MVSESESGTEEEQATMGEEASTGGMEEQEEAPAEITEAVVPEAKAAPKKKVSGRRAALRIVREGVDRVSKELGTFRKSQEASAKRLEKQMAALRSDIAALKSHVAKETARVREKQDATFSKVLSKLSTPKATKKPAAKKKTSKPKKSKGKK